MQPPPHFTRTDGAGPSSNEGPAREVSSQGPRLRAGEGSPCWAPKAHPRWEVAPPWGSRQVITGLFAGVLCHTLPGYLSQGRAHQLTKGSDSHLGSCCPTGRRSVPHAGCGSSRCGGKLSATGFSGSDVLGLAQGKDSGHRVSSPIRCSFSGGRLGTAQQAAGLGEAVINDDIKLHFSGVFYLRITKHKNSHTVCRVRTWQDQELSQ